MVTTPTDNTVDNGTGNGAQVVPMPSGGLRQARKEQAAARRAAKPTPSNPKNRVASPAKKAVAKQPAAKKAAAAKPARSTATATTAASKLRWQFESGYDNRQTTGQTASANGGTYALKPTGDGTWMASFTADGKKAQVLAEGSAGKCYSAAVEHNRNAQTA